MIWMNLKKDISKYRKQLDRSFIVSSRKLNNVNEEAIKGVEEKMYYYNGSQTSKLKVIFLYKNKQNGLKI